ncbi:MAG: hypothetical protein ABJH28_03445 [Paraglaciecola sp.]|uniref:hypothetical protein n=1 Tax=Paraglaciecola sp. TaxID=1920173 RepID=UPI0032646A2A
MSFISTFDKIWFDISRKSAPVHQNIEWISYHIPKTAGSSLRLSMERAYSTQAIYGVYRQSGAKQLNIGGNIWLPKEAKVIHGHFRSHVNHYKYFPNAKRMVWVRDPIERAWSFLGHILDVKEKNPQYQLLKSRYLDKGINDKAKLFECLINDNELNHFLFTYQRYFKQVSIEQFDFVGSMHCIKKDFARLSDFLGTNLVIENKNKRTESKDLPTAVRRLENLFSDEYDVVGKYLNK